MTEKKKTWSRETVQYAFKASLPVMAGYVVLGTGFGILLENKGYAWWWALFMSISIYAGSMQYVAIDLLSGGATLLASAIMTVMVNIRHIFYGITMLEEYKKAKATKPYIIFALTDETYSLVCSADLPEQVDRQGYYFLVSIMNQSYWIVGSVLGSILSGAIEFNSAGVDFAMTALFVVIFVEQWEGTKNHLPALSGIFITVISLMVFGPQDFLIPAMVGITVVLSVGKKWMVTYCKEDEDNA